MDKDGHKMGTRANTGNGQETGRRAKTG